MHQSPMLKLGSRFPLLAHHAMVTYTTCKRHGYDCDIIGLFVGYGYIDCHGKMHLNPLTP